MTRDRTYTFDSPEKVVVDAEGKILSVSFGPDEVRSWEGVAAAIAEADRHDEEHQRQRGEDG